MKRVLFITYDFPYPANTGGKNRALNMLQFSGNGFEKYLISFVRDDYKQKDREKLEQLGIKVLDVIPRKKLKDVSNLFGVLSKDSFFRTLYYSKSTMDQIINAIQNFSIDIVHFESFYTAFFISDKINELGVKQIFGTENIEYRLYEDYMNSSNVFVKQLIKSQVEKIKKEEISFYKKADLCLAVTDDEASFIKQYKEKCLTIPNGVDVNDFVFHEPKNKIATKLLFVGNFSYFPNVEGINLFYNSVFKNLGSDIGLNIIGKRVETLKFLDDKRITATEYVDDIKKVYSEADILISPIKIGGGTNFKVLEAMASGLPIIAYRGRLEALGLKDKKDVLMVDNEEEFVKSINMLVQDLSLRQDLARNARAFVEKNYSWEVIGEKLAQAWNSL